jgi:hypothetical protein
MTHQDPKIGERVNKLWIALLFGLLMAVNVGAELYISNQATGTSTENKVDVDKPQYNFIFGGRSNKTGVMCPVCKTEMVDPNPGKSCAVMHYGSRCGWHDPVCPNSSSHSGGGGQITPKEFERLLDEVERSTPTTFNMYGSTQIVKTECFEWIHKWLDKPRMETKGNSATLTYTESICTKEYLFMSDGRVLWRKVEP